MSATVQEEQVITSFSAVKLKEDVEAAPAPKPANPFTVAIISSIGYCAIIGCLIRIGSDYLFGQTLAKIEDSNTVVLVSTIANIIGSVIIGLLFYENKPSSSLYTGLATGMCGSITTYSKYNQQISMLFLGRSGSSGVPQVTALAAIVVGMLTFSASYHLGKDSSIIRDNIRFAKSSGSFQTRLSFLILAVFVILFSVLLGVFFETDEKLAKVCLAALFAPFGANLRYYLGKKVPKFSTKSFPALNMLPTGTLAANFLGSLLLALIHVLDKNLTQTCDRWIVVYALQTGFLACLTTVSTFMSEINGLRLKNVKAAYLYAGTTLVLCISTACLINGVGLMYGDDKTTVANCSF